MGGFRKWWVKLPKLANGTVFLPKNAEKKALGVWRLGVFPTIEGNTHMVNSCFWFP